MSFVWNVDIVWFLIWLYFGIFSIFISCFFLLRMSQKKKQMFHWGLLSSLLGIQMRSRSQMTAPPVKGCAHCRWWAHYLSNVSANEDWSASTNKCICCGRGLSLTRRARPLAVFHHRQKGMELCTDQTRLHAHKDYCCLVSRVPILLLDARAHKLKTFVEYVRTHAQRTELHLTKAMMLRMYNRSFTSTSYRELIQVPGDEKVSALVFEPV